MADIDKALPNVETEIKIPSDEQVTEVEQEQVEEQVPWLQVPSRLAWQVRSERGCCQVHVAFL